jgi:hypothetical protein
VLAADHGLLIANAVKWALGRRPQVEVEGRAVLDIALREGNDGLAVTLVNLSNPMMMKGPIRQVYPVGRQVVSVAIPAGRSFKSASLLVSGDTGRAKVVGDRVEVEVPGIELIEVVHLTWG